MNMFCLPQCPTDLELDSPHARLFLSTASIGNLALGWLGVLYPPESRETLNR